MQQYIIQEQYTRFRILNLTFRSIMEKRITWPPSTALVFSRTRHFSSTSQRRTWPAIQRRNYPSVVEFLVQQMVPVVLYSQTVKKGKISTSQIRFGISFFHAATATDLSS